MTTALPPDQALASAREALTPEDRFLCAETATAFFVHMDQGNYDLALEQLAPEVQWLRRGEVLDGPAAIKAALEARSPSLVSRHVVVNLNTVSVGVDIAECSFTVLAFQAQAEASSAPPKLSGPAAVLSCKDVMVRKGGLWKIRRKTSAVIFLQA